MKWKMRYYVKVQGDKSIKRRSRGYDHKKSKCSYTF